MNKLVNISIEVKIDNNRIIRFEGEEIIFPEGPISLNEIELAGDISVELNEILTLVENYHANIRNS